MDDQQSVLFTLGIDDITQSHLLSIAKWNKFLAIVGIVLCGLGLLSVIFGFGMIMSNFFNLGHGYGSPVQENFESGFYAGTIIIYLVFTAIFFIPCIYRLSFSNKMIKALARGDQQLLNDSLQKLRVYSKYWGILTIIIIAMYLILFIVAMFAFLIR